MKSEQERPVGKIGYEKPTAVDLGAVAPVVGASCVTGDTVDTNSFCAVLGNSASSGCGLGNDANKKP